MDSNVMDKLKLLVINLPEGVSRLLNTVQY
jgi:hypothetical protein